MSHSRFQENKALKN